MAYRPEVGRAQEGTSREQVWNRWLTLLAVVIVGVSGYTMGVQDADEARDQTCRVVQQAVKEVDDENPGLSVPDAVTEVRRSLVEDDEESCDRSLEELVRRDKRRMHRVGGP